jgi:hypothetical protein
VAGHTLTVSADGSAVKVRRLLSFGAGGRLTFEANMYSAIKRFFDDVARRDAVSITVRKTDGGNRP